MLRVENIDVFYGKRKALNAISLAVNKSEIVTIIGSNGVGKTTTLKTICGLLKPRVGKIFFNDIPIEKKHAHEHARLGISYVPEGGRVFKNLTIRENLEMGAFVKKDPRRMMADLDMIFEMFPVLRARQTDSATTLSGGERQMLSIGRSLMSRPKLLLLDEPSLGLGPLIVKGIYEKIAEIRENGVTILLVEQNVKRALDISDRGYVYGIGRINIAGSATDLLKNDNVRKTFLGEE